MYYNMAVSSMIFKLQLKENIKHAIICTIKHLKCVGHKQKTKYNLSQMKRHF